MKTVRSWWPLAGLLMTSASGCSQAAAPAEDPSNMKCVRRLQLPFYAPIAQSARVTGSVTAATVVAPDGGMQSVAFEEATGSRPDSIRKLLGPAVERALKASRFDGSCAGKTVRTTFVFVMDKPAPETWFEFPNRFEIGVPSPILNTTAGNR